MTIATEFPHTRDSLMSGIAGEYLVSYMLTRAGVQPTMVDVHGPDIWYRTRDGIIRTVEVKTAYAPTFQSSTHKRPSYSFQVPKKEADLIAFVALDTERVLFKPTDDLPDYNTVRIKEEEFSLVRIIASLDLIHPMKEAA